MTADATGKSVLAQQVLDQLELYYGATERLMSAVGAGNEEEIEQALTVRSEVCHRLLTLYHSQEKKEAATKKEEELPFDLPVGWLSNILGELTGKEIQQGEEWCRKIIVLEEEIRVAVVAWQLQLQKKLEDVRERRNFLHGYRASIKQVNDLPPSVAKSRQETNKNSLPGVKDLHVDRYL